MKIKELIEKLEIYNKEMDVKILKGIDDGSNNDLEFKKIKGVGLFTGRENCFYFEEEE